MEKIFDNPFCNMYISKKDALMKTEWQVASSEMSDEQFKELGLVLLSKIKEYKPTRIFADNRNFLYTITPVMQNWFVEKVIMPAVNISIKRHAELLPAEIFPQVSMEQLHEEKEDLGIDYVTAYFEDETKALEWILKS